MEIADLTLEELEAIKEALSQLVLDGFADSDEDPVVTALVKVTEAIQIYEEGDDVSEISGGVRDF